jgi:Ser/Thr protein kinase RdoA (MazF antagonist)
LGNAEEIGGTMTTAAKTHGLDGTLVEPDWAPLELAEVRALLAEFDGFVEPIEILSTSPRPFSAASVVRAGTRRVFVKRHPRSVRDAEGLREEHGFMAHLRAHGVAVPEVLRAITGESALERGEWTYEVHSTPLGIDLYEDAISWTPFLSVGHARAAGTALARLHLAARDYDASARKVQPLVASFTIFAGNDAESAMRCYLNARPMLALDAATRGDCAQGLELLKPFHRELRPLLPALLSQWTHNDLHASNLLWSDASAVAQTTAIIDFGLADRTNAVHDLAHAIERNIVEWLVLTADPARDNSVPVHHDHLIGLLDGYASVRPLSNDEAAALAPMLAVCHAEFALTEADYFLGVLHSPERARVATRDYLVGHARWFHSDTGQELLRAIRAWTEARDQAAGRVTNR